MKNLVAASLALLFTLCTHAQEDESKEKKPSTPSFNVSNQVARVFDALARRDFAAICEADMDFAAGIVTVKADSPGFLLTNRLAKYYASISNSFNWYSPMDQIAALRPEREIADVRPRFIRYLRPGRLEGEDIPAFDVYVVLRFKSWTNAPFMNGIGIRNPQFTGQIIRQFVVRCVFEQSGLLNQMLLIEEGKETFSELPFSIVGVNFAHQEFIDIYVVGGKPPFKTETTVNRVDVEPLTRVMQGSVGIRLSLGEDLYRTRLQRGAQTPKATIKIRDAAGKEDSCSFIVPRFIPDNADYTRTPTEAENWQRKPPFILKHPWADNRHWKNTFLVDGEPPISALEAYQPWK